MQASKTWPDSIITFYHGSSIFFMNLKGNVLFLEHISSRGRCLQNVIKNAVDLSSWQFQALMCVW